MAHIITAPGSPPVTRFQDTFVRANRDTLGKHYMRTMPFEPAGTSNTGVAVIETNQCKLLATLAGTANFAPLWINLDTYLNIYDKPGQYIQVRFQVDTLAGSAGLALRYNHDLNNTESETEGSDVYYLLMKGGAAGRIDKRVGSGAQTTVGAATWGALTAGDIIRFEAMTVGSTVVLQAIRNGVILQTVTDNSATAILNGGPAFGWISISAINQALKFDNLDTGVLTALST